MLPIAAFLVLSLQQCIFGRLPHNEVEDIFEKYITKTTETLLVAFLVRERIDVYYVLNFVALSAGRVWAWITAGRVTFVEQQPLTAWKLRVQFTISLSLTVAFDTLMFAYVASPTRDTVRRTMPMFAFEFADLAILSSSIAARYLSTIAGVLRRTRRTGAGIFAHGPCDVEQDVLEGASEEDDGNTRLLFSVELWTGKCDSAISFYAVLRRSGAIQTYSSWLAFPQAQFRPAYHLLLEI